jgi:hypothetical protein
MFENSTILKNNFICMYEKIFTYQNQYITTIFEIIEYICISINKAFMK